MNIFIDTDVQIEYMRNNEKLVQRFLEVYKKEERRYYSPATRAEIVAGLRQGEEEVTSRLFGLMECLKIDDQVGRKAGEYMKAYRAWASHSAELADALVAATAYVNDVSLWTMNRKHYPMKDIDFFS